MTIQATVKQILKIAEQQAQEKAIAALPDNLRELTGYLPRELQAVLDEQERRFNVLVVHRRFGKTVREINKLIERAVECPFPDGRYIYGAPTYSQAEDIAWVHLENYAGKIPGARPEKGKLAYWLPTRPGSKARVRLYGFDSPKQRVRGLYADGAVLDEFPWIPPSAWSQQIRPMLMDENRRGVDRFGHRNQWADFIFTPFGRNHAYTFYKNATLWCKGEPVMIRDPMTGEDKPVYSDEWFAALYKASETGILNADEMAAACAEMDMLPGTSKYEQEMECSFDAAVEGSIFGRVLELIKSQGRVADFRYNRLLPVSTAWDLGMDDSTAIWFFQQIGDGVVFIDYYENSGKTLDHYADIMAEKGYRYGYNLLPHDVEVREQGLIGKDKTRKAILETLGVRVTTVPRYSPKLEGIPAAQVLMMRSHFDEKACVEGLDRLALYRREWDERRQVFRAEPLHDSASHGASAFMQCAMGIKKLRSAGYNRQSQGVMH